MKWYEFKLGTFIGEFPKYINQNFQTFKNYIDLFYDEKRDILKKPLETTGRVKATTGEFINVITENLTVRNWNDTSTNIPIDPSNIEFVNSYNSPDIVPTCPNPNSLYPQHSSYKWIICDNNYYYKINNANPVGFYPQAVGQEIFVIYNRQILTGPDYTILLDPQDIASITSGQRVLKFEPRFAPISYHKLVCIDLDPEFGPRWAVKEWGGAMSLEIVNYNTDIC